MPYSKDQTGPNNYALSTNEALPDEIDKMTRILERFMYLFT